MNGNQTNWPISFAPSPVPFMVGPQNTFNSPSAVMNPPMLVPQFGYVPPFSTNLPQQTGPSSFSTLPPGYQQPPISYQYQPFVNYTPSQMNFYTPLVPIPNFVIFNQNSSSVVNSSSIEMQTPLVHNNNNNNNNHVFFPNLTNSVENLEQSGNEGDGPTNEMKKKCTKCQRYYLQSENNTPNACQYHTGIYKSVYQSKMAAGTYMIWSCCQNPKQEGTWCKQGLHVECKKTSQILSHFQPVKIPPQDSRTEEVLVDLSNENQFPDDQMVPNNLFSTKKKNIKPFTLDLDSKIIEVKGQKYIKHFVKRIDTLQGLSLHYQVSVAEIRHINRLLRDTDLWTRHQVLIPFNGQKLQELSEEEKERLQNDMKRRMVKRFMTKSGTKCESQAKYYLEINGYDIETALCDFSEDVAWELSQPPNNL